MSAASKHRVYFLLQRTAHRMKKYADKLAMEAGGVTTAQAAVLNVIISERSVSQARIAKTLSQRESAITTMAARLEDAGFITKVRSQKDRRQWELKPTRKGRAAHDKMVGALSDANKLLDNAITESRMNDLADTLELILDELDKPDC